MYPIEDQLLFFVDVNTSWSIKLSGYFTRSPGDPTTNYPLKFTNDLREYHNH